jgi:hypothetical protein
MCKVCEPGGIPPILCRRCHPELNATPEEMRQAQATEKAHREADNAAQKMMREIAKAQTRIDAILRKGEPPEGSVNATILKSMRKKLARLRKEGAQ